MQNKSINEITLFRYLFNLDNRNLPQSILSWFAKVDNDTDSDREHAVKELATLKGNCMRRLRRSLYLWMPWISPI